MPVTGMRDIPHSGRKKCKQDEITGGKKNETNRKNDQVPCGAGMHGYAVRNGYVLFVKFCEGRIVTINAEETQGC